MRKDLDYQRRIDAYNRAAHDDRYRRLLSRFQRMSQYPDEELGGSNGHYARTAETIRRMYEHLQRRGKVA